MTTVYDVARVAGVSTATVSRVVRGSSLVHPETRQRVLAVIEMLGFVPDAAAQGLSRRRKDVIGLVAVERGLSEIDIERDSLLFVDQIVHAVEAVLRDTEYSLLAPRPPASCSIATPCRRPWCALTTRWPSACSASSSARASGCPPTSR